MWKTLACILYTIIVPFGWIHTYQSSGKCSGAGSIKTSAEASCRTIWAGPVKSCSQVPTPWGSSLGCIKRAPSTSSSGIWTLLTPGPPSPTFEGTTGVAHTGRPHRRHSTVRRNTHAHTHTHTLTIYAPSDWCIYLPGYYRMVEQSGVNKYLQRCK